MFCSCNVAFSSLPVFLPTIINEYVDSYLRLFLSISSLTSIVLHSEYIVEDEVCN